MAYKVMKKEFVRQRPKWLIRLLFEISAGVYVACDTLEQAQAHFRTIYEGIEKMRLFELNPKLCLNEHNGKLYINSIRGRRYIMFYIDKNYKTYL